MVKPPVCALTRAHRLGLDLELGLELGLGGLGFEHMLYPPGLVLVLASVRVRVRVRG